MAVTTGTDAGTGGATTRRPVPPFWEKDSTPFSAVDDAGNLVQPCEIVLRQIDDNNFSVRARLQVQAPAGMADMPETPLTVETRWLQRCDLASIPSVVGWFARRHGRHTPASLVHDLLIVTERSPLPPDVPPEWQLGPEQADVLFRELLLASGVPPVRSYLMWAAVAARTRWHGGARRRTTLILWGACAAVGSVALVIGLVQGNGALVAAALVAPAVAAGLWGGQYPAGVVAGYAAWWAVAGSAPAYVAYKLYQGVELVVRLVGKMRKRDIPPPPPFNER